MLRLAIAVVIALAEVHAAHAYPQFQLGRDQTCSNCHLSPAGGGQLSENGLNSAQQMSQWGTAPELFFGKLATPSWLVLGGDLRAATGLDNVGLKNEVVAFPMQFEAYADAAIGQLSFHVTAGARDPQYGNTASTLFSSREHWLMWQENPGEGSGLFVRAGRFMPVYGLRLAEHPDYTRRFGGTPLYGEAYGVVAEYIRPGWELHATAFIHDPIFLDSLELGDGVALYGETRVTASTSLGIEAMFVKDPDDQRTFGGLTAKHYLSGPDLLLQLEIQGVHEKVDAGGTANQLVAYAMGSYFVATALMVDVGLGYFSENLAVKGLDRESLDLNVHWFATSHLELILTNRLQLLELGSGGTNSGYSLLQIHYRL
jgi:hypothetical protein